MAITSAMYNQDGNSITVVQDGNTILVPVAEGNRHYIELQEWVKAGNSIQLFTKTITDQDVNVERLRRITAGATFNGILVTGSNDDARNLTNLALAAQLAIASNTSTTFIFRDGNNIDHELTPVQMLGLWQQSATYVSKLYEKSWALKAMSPIPSDYTFDSYWV